MKTARRLKHGSDEVKNRGFAGVLFVALLDLVLPMTSPEVRFTILRIGIFPRARCG